MEDIIDSKISLNQNKSKTNYKRKSSNNEFQGPVHPRILQEKSHLIKQRWIAIAKWFQANYPFVPGCNVVETLTRLPGDKKYTHSLGLVQTKLGFRFEGIIAPSDEYDEHNLRLVTDLPIDHMFKLADYLPEFKRRYCKEVDRKLRDLDRGLRVFDRTIEQCGIDLADFDREDA